MDMIDELEPRRLFAAYREAELTLDDGGRLTAAFHRNSKGHTITLSRYDRNGGLDADFGTNGTATIGNVLLFSDAGENFKVILDHAGRPLVLSQTNLFRMKADGGRDKTFDGDGRLTLPVVKLAADLDVDARNRPVIAGTSAGKTGDRGTLIRLGERGALDKSFGSGGAFKRAVPQDKKLKIPGDSTGIGVHVLDDGNILGVARFEFQKFQSRSDGYFAIGLDAFRVDATGTPDLSYGKKGATGYTNTFFAGSEDRTETIERFFDNGGVRVKSFYDADQDGTGTLSRHYIDPDGGLDVTRPPDDIIE